MLNKDLSPVLKGNVSRYSLVIATAKLARKISEKELEEKILSTEKTVSQALNQILDGKYKVVEATDIED